MVKTAASLLACDLSSISSELERCRRAGTDWIHFDVMDGVFVDQISYGSPVLQCIRGATKLPVDVHLMVEDPTHQIALFAEAGADIIDIHVESYCDTAAVLGDIRRRGKKPALAVRPSTPIEAVYPFLKLCDMVLVMTVEPGYGGQHLIPHTLEKIAALRKAADGMGLTELDIEVDGGINTETASMVKQAGANVLVAGTALFNAPDMGAADKQLKSAVSR